MFVQVLAPRYVQYPLAAQLRNQRIIGDVK